MKVVILKEAANIDGVDYRAGSVVSVSDIPRRFVKETVRDFVKQPPGPPKFKSPSSDTDTTTLRFMLKIAMKGKGAVDVSPSKPLYALDEVVLLTATADAKADFVGWDGDLQGTDNPAKLVINDDLKVVALFVDKAKSKLQ